jgi:hypothetical protein
MNEKIFPVTPGDVRDRDNSFGRPWHGRGRRSSDTRTGERDAATVTRAGETAKRGAASVDDPELAEQIGRKHDISRGRTPLPMINRVSR